MKLNHLNICTANVSAAATFFETYLGFRRMGSAASETMAALRDEAGFVLLFSNFNKKVKPTYPEGFHFGFILDSKDEVNGIYEKLHEAGYAAEPPCTMHGSWTFYFRAPGDVLVEVQCAN